MSRILTRKTLNTLAIAVLVLAILAAVASGGQSNITKARLERNLPQTFSNIYVKQARILGHRGITTQSLHARASCDKGGPKVADHGPGSDWICMMAWSDPNVPLPDGAAKFELNVHSNDCYTAGGPSKYVGTLTITDTKGRDVTNPAFEFDSCFDPKGNNRPTGNDALASGSSSTKTPTEQAAATSTVALPSGTMAADRHGVIAPSLVCSVGKDGCGGTITATADGKMVSTTYAIATDDHQPVTLPLPKGTTGPVTLKVTPVIGNAPKPTSTITVVSGR